MCLKYGKSQPKRAYKVRAYKKKVYCSKASRSSRRLTDAFCLHVRAMKRSDLLTCDSVGRAIRPTAYARKR